jgi:hypothetical protein
MKKSKMFLWQRVIWVMILGVLAVVVNNLILLAVMSAETDPVYAVITEDDYWSSANLLDSAAELYLPRTQDSYRMVKQSEGVVIVKINSELPPPPTP